jgi:hypothetical protein
MTPRKNTTADRDAFMKALADAEVDAPTATTRGRKVTPVAKAMAAAKARKEAQQTAVAKAKLAKENERSKAMAQVNTPKVLTGADFFVGQPVQFAANGTWYPGLVTKATKVTVTVDYTKGSGQKYTQTVNPSKPFHAGAKLGTVPSQVRPDSIKAKATFPTTASLAGELAATIDTFAGKQVAGLDKLRAAAADADAVKASERIAEATAARQAAEARKELQWGTAKTHDLHDGDELWYGGQSRTKPRTEPIRGTYRDTGPSNRWVQATEGGGRYSLGGVATRFHAAKIVNEAKVVDAVVKAVTKGEKASAAGMAEHVAKTAANAKAQASKKATPAKVAKAAAPAKKVVARTDPAHVTKTNLAGFPIGPAEPNQERIGRPVDGHPGYYVRYARGAYDLAARVGENVGAGGKATEVDGPSWLAICRHGNSRGSEQLMGPDTSAEKLAARRKEWCPKCAENSPATDYTALPKASPAKATAAKQATPRKRTAPVVATEPDRSAKAVVTAASRRKANRQAVSERLAELAK